MRMSKRMQNYGPLPILLVAFGVFGCDQQPETPTAQDLAVGQSDAGNRDGSAEESAPASIDWSSVETLPGLAGMGEVVRAVRHLTYWHSGSKKLIYLRFQPPGSAVDDWGNKISMSPAQWKAMTRKVRSSPRQPMPMLTRSGSIMDSFGQLPRYVYRIQVDQDRIRFTCDGLYEDLYPE